MPRDGLGGIVAVHRVRPERVRKGGFRVGRYADLPRRGGALPNYNVSAPIWFGAAYLKSRFYFPTLLPMSISRFAPRMTNARLNQSAVIGRSIPQSRHAFPTILAISIKFGWYCVASPVPNRKRLFENGEFHPASRVRCRKRSTKSTIEICWDIFMSRPRHGQVRRSAPYSLRLYALTVKFVI